MDEEDLVAFPSTSLQIHNFLQPTKTRFQQSDEWQAQASGRAVQPAENASRAPED